MYQAKSNSSSEDDHLGLSRNTVRMRAYSGLWPQCFRKEQTKILQSLAPLTPQIVHIGSTSVPHLAAKPIIDILIGVNTAGDNHLICNHLIKLGYESHGEKGVPGRLFFSKGEPCCFHVHLVNCNGKIWDNHILFRNSLIADPTLASAYETLKRKLARQFPNDRDSYTQGKANFIENTLQTLRSR